jgi:hypothetical protein
MGATAITGVGPGEAAFKRTIVRDGQIKVNYDDKYPGYPIRKIIAGGGINIYEINVGGDEKLVIAAVGSGTGDKFYEHDQVTPSTTWLVNHNLQKFPSVTTVDSGNNVVIGDVDYITNNQLVVTFTSAFGGKAYCN